MSGKFEKVEGSALNQRRKVSDQQLTTPVQGQMSIQDLQEAWEAERQLHEAQKASMEQQPSGAEAPTAAPEEQDEDLGEQTLVIGPEMLGFYKLLRAYNSHLPYEGYLVPEALSVVARPDAPAELTITILVSLPGTDDLVVDDQ